MKRALKKKFPSLWRHQEKVQNEHHLKSDSLSFSKTWSLSKTLLAYPRVSSHITQTHAQTHTRTLRLWEQMNSHRHQRAGSVDDTHWNQMGPQREDGWLKRSCLPCFPHILITHYSEIFSSEGGQLSTKTPLFSPYFTLRDWMALQFLQQVVSLFRAGYIYVMQTFSNMTPFKKLSSDCCSCFTTNQKIKSKEDVARSAVW